MKRIAMPVLVLIAFLIFASSGPAWALDPVDIGVEIHAGRSNFSNSNPTLDSDPIEGIGFEARKGPLSLELSADWIKTDVKQDFQFVSGIPPILIVSVLTVEGGLRIVPILLTGRLHLGANDDRIDPYIGVGGGYYLLSYDPSSTVSPLTGAGISHDTNFHNTAGFHADLGLDIRVTSALALTLDARHVWANAKVSYKGDLAVLNTGSSRLSLDGWVTTFGMKYYFKN